MRKIDYAAQIAQKYVGCPYVFAATGQTCTPSFRKNRAAARPAYKENIYKYCPVLSGKKNSCDGCKYKGKRSFDCRGLTYIICKEAGMSINSIGATSQYNADTWIEKGPIEKMPANTPCCVFRQDPDNPSTMKHTGFNCGDGYVIDSRSHSAGTVKKPLSSYKWTHYAIPKGAYDEITPTPEPTPEPEPTTSGSGTRATIRKGSKGTDVTTLQKALLQLGYSLPRYGADGDFGSETLAAVKVFQAENALTIDGIVGPATWNKIDALLNAQTEAETPDVKYTVTIKGVDAATATYLLECYPGAAATEET